jgi:putative ABC transport system permease protein
MDGFVMLMFVFEAAIQGVAGSLIGIVVGFALAALRGLAGYGALFFESVPWGSLAVVACGAVFVGIMLAAVSAVSPAWMAARLAPMEAMRVE